MSASSDSNTPSGFGTAAAVIGAVAKPAPRAADVSSKASVKNAVAGDVVDASGPTPYYRAMARFFANFTRDSQPSLAEQA